MTKEIKGTIMYMSFEGGFWGIDAGKEKYQPDSMPEQLKYPGSVIECKVKILDDMISFHNWGTPCKIISFSTLSKP